MNKEEILKEIQKTKEHLTNMEKMLEECKSKRWEPKIYEHYFIVNASCEVLECSNYNQAVTDKHMKALNCFKTKAEATAKAEKILVRRQLEDIARRLNNNKTLNWKSQCQHKYSIYFDYREDKIDTYPTTVPYKEQGTVYCLDENFKDVAIKEIGEERLTKYLKGE